MTSTSTNAAASVVVARLFLPDDANIAGNVHGGTTLKLMEEAGMIAATRHMSSSEANKESGGNCKAGLVRFEHMAFHKPVFVGEVGSCTCEIIFTSRQSILVEVVVTAENVSKGEARITNTGWLWYVPMAPSTVNPSGSKRDWKPVQARPMAMPEGGVALKKYEKAKAMYEERKSSMQSCSKDSDEVGGANDRIEICLEKFKSQYTTPLSECRSPAESEQVLCQMVLPGNCGAGKVAFGGFIMKIMDNAAGCSAFRHCRTNIVTVAISDLDFVSPVRLGDLVTVRSKVVFASSKSLDIEVVASVVSASSIGEDAVVAKGLFTFVSIGSDGKAQSVPKLRLESDEDMTKAWLGKQRYEAAKKARLVGKH